MINPAGTDNSILELRKAEIQAMPPGPEKDAALAALVRDYEGELSASNLQSEQGYEMANAAMPTGTDTGRTYVAANPLEHMAAGLRAFKGNRDVRDARREQKEMSAAKQQAMMELLRAGAGGAGGGAPFAMPGRVTP